MIVFLLAVSFCSDRQVNHQLHEWLASVNRSKLYKIRFHLTAEAAVTAGAPQANRLANGTLQAEPAYVRLCCGVRLLSVSFQGAFASGYEPDDLRSLKSDV